MGEFVTRRIRTHYVGYDLSGNAIYSENSCPTYNFYFKELYTICKLYRSFISSNNATEKIAMSGTLHTTCNYTLVCSSQAMLVLFRIFRIFSMNTARKNLKLSRNFKLILSKLET